MTSYVLDEEDKYEKEEKGKNLTNLQYLGFVAVLRVKLYTNLHRIQKDLKIQMK